MNISISFREAYGKKVQEIYLNSIFSRMWAAVEVHETIECWFPHFFFTLILQKWTKTDTQFWKVQSTKGEQSCKNHQVLVTENWENDDHFRHFGFSSRSTNFFILHRFSEISQKVSPTFFIFLFCKVYGVFSMVNCMFFLALSGPCSLELLKHKS